MPTQTQMDTRLSDIILTVDGLHKSFADKEVLNNISLQAKQGDVVSILGKSGSGKSTFLRCINFLEMPSRGRISLLNQTVDIQQGEHSQTLINQHQLIQLRSQMGMVFQQFNLWSHMTVLDNVTLPLTTVLKIDKTTATSKAMEYLSQVNMADWCEHYPAQLSGGQQQRVAIARTLAMEPAIMLFDEPTSALDPEWVEEVLQVMRALAQQGKTMLVVTHEMKFAREVSNRVVFLHEGQIVEDGDPQQVFAQPQSEHFKKFIANEF